MSKTLPAIDADFFMRNTMRTPGIAKYGARRAILLTGIAADTFFRINLDEKKFIRIRSRVRRLIHILNLFHFNQVHSYLRLL
jgi:hypothetical protein